ncbi:MAG: deoxynucleoside kinase [Proteobacteria bacterium]|nr:deoxynucleoside kinase [Pseudomonadota bacterium]
MRRYIAVEGLIGVGKTTLCRLLRDHWGGRLILEPSDHNPFLEPYYEDPDRFAFPVQMFYLVTRWHQQDQVRQEDLFSGTVIADYVFRKDRLFAEKTLDERELGLYDRFADVLGGMAPKPDLLIYLEAPTDVLMQRIEKRAMPGEYRIEPEYLDDLRARYEVLLAEWSDCPLLRINNQDLDYAEDPAGKKAILEKIERALAGDLPPGPTGSTLDRQGQTELFGAGG